MSSFSNPPGPLTTIFTPSVDCFDSPALTQPFQTCGYRTNTLSGSQSVSCFWSQPSSCYPTGGIVKPQSAQVPFSFGGDVRGKHFLYSPGVLPSGFSNQYETTHTGYTTIAGCYSGWSTMEWGWCTKSTSGLYTIDSQPTSGVFAALVPQVRVMWNSYELPQFTPASAPVLPAATLAQFESSIAAKPVTPASTPSSTKTFKGTSTSITNDQSSAPGLSAGAKAGIGIGVAVAVLLLLILGFVVLRRRKRASESSPQQTGSTQYYVDTKAELGNEERQRAELEHQNRHELAGYHPPELAAYNDSPFRSFGVSPKA